MRILVFDTETTGLPTERNPSIMDTEKWPHIIQLSFIVYDTNEMNVVTCKDHIIKLDASVEISQESINIHGITRSQCMRKGIPIEDALNEFNDALRNADWAVGHNISFDKRMIMAESNRIKTRQYFTKGNGTGIKEYCTMKHAVDLCKIEAVGQNGETYYKYPKLEELHQHLFGNFPNGTHDSMGDVLICLRCYGWMVHNHDIAKSGSATLRNLYKRYCN